MVIYPAMKLGLKDTRKGYDYEITPGRRVGVGGYGDYKRDPSSSEQQAISTSGP